ncbi:MAG: hypothetical protein U9N33_06420 [Campylobacterota bacterium]|nr:hypothetical protein [Campylobacterota bacterium]
MSKLERIKEELNWLKVLFALMVASDFSLLAWLVQNYFSNSDIRLLLVGVFAVIAVTMILVVVSIVARKKIDELEEL